ncbi:MAG: PAS domain S-box protein [Georgfuchsia sp.]
MPIHSLTLMQPLSLILLLIGVGLAFSHIRLSGWVLGWILLSGALLLEGFRFILSNIAEHGFVDPAIYTVANDWMGLGFSLLIVAAMYMMREVFARHRLAAESLRAISTAANDAIIIMDSAGTITSWNQAAQRIFGHEQQEAQGRKLRDLIVPEHNRIDFDNIFNLLGSDARKSMSGTPAELAGLRKNGTRLVTEYSISRINIGGKWHAIYIVRDITARKQAEVESRARTTALEILSAKMLSGDELEKKKLAYGLHEGLAQTLASVKMLIERKLTQFAPGNGRDRRVYDNALASTVPLLQSAINDVQTIASDLRPSILDELGLLPTIDWFCRKFNSLYPAIEIAQEISVQENDMPVPLKIAIYRIIESAFTDIVRYENPDQIELALRMHNDAISLTIADTSHGSRRAAAMERDSDSDLQVRFGEAKERTTLSGGSFTIARNEAGGVSLRAKWAA